MRVLIASSSFYRQSCYREILEDLGHEATIVSGGVECIEQLRRRAPDLLLLEAPLLWGGSDGVLDVLQAESAAVLPIVVISYPHGSHDWFQLSRFRVDDFLVRFPTPAELGAAVERCTTDRVRPRGRAAGDGGFRGVAAALPLQCDLPAPGAAS